jgi:PAS domain S-box-containing protein
VDFASLQIIDALPVAIYTTDAEGRLTHFNAATVELTGETPTLGTRLSQAGWKLYREDGTLLPFESYLMAPAPTEAPRPRGERIVVERADGTRSWVVAYPNLLRDRHGKPAGSVNMLVDVTTLKASEEYERRLTAEANAFAEANAKFRVFFEQGSYFAGVMALDGTVLEANRLCLEECGFMREQVIGRKFWDCPWWSPSPALMQMIREATAQTAAGTVFRRESNYFVADGSQRVVDLILTPVKDESGRVLFIAPTGTDITDRKQDDRTKARLAAIVESSDDAIISKDLNSIIMTWNAGATRLFGYTADEAIGRSITMLMPPERIDEEPSILERIRHGERIEHYETIRRRKDGSSLEISLTVSPIIDDHGTIVGASKIARDITDRKRAERALLEADRQKNEFLATLAHELRNPLAPIRNSLNILRLGRGDLAGTERVQEMMERQVNHMVRLVDDLLEISRITTGKIELRLELIEIASVIRSAVETSGPLIDANRHQLAIKLPREPLTVEADAVRLSQVVANLLNNAAKYTDPGGQIWLNVWREAAEVVISVRDSGIGIAPELLPHVLEMFTQAERARRHSQDGLGIGLALVKRLVEMHGGVVRAHSAGEGKGSEFTIRLPLSHQQSTEEEPAPAATSAAPRDRQKILVVDDNVDAASSLAMLLRLLGSEVETAHDGCSALRVFETFQPSVVLLDLGMPDMSGYEVARRMRGMPQFQKMTLVALTGWGQDDDRRRTQEAGFDVHLVKPVNLDALQVLLAEVQQTG